jgi:hypothetical protein
MSGTEDDFEQTADQAEPQPTQPTDPVADAIEAISFMDESAPAKLRGAIAAGVAEERYQQALRDESIRTQKKVADFLQENEQYTDPDLQALEFQTLVRLQREDLGKFLDIPAWEKAQGRQATPDEIAHWHAQNRVAGRSEARDPLALMNEAASYLHEKFGIKGRRDDIDRSRERAMAQRVARAAELTGRPRQVIDWGRSSDSDEHHVTEIAATPESETTRLMGAPDAPAPTDRSSAAQRMIEHRKALRGSDGTAIYRGRIK